MPRFYCPPPIPLSGEMELPVPAAHHATRVLRLHAGDTIQLFDGEGNERQGRIASVEGKRVVISSLTETNVVRESPLRVLLAQSMTSSEKMDWIIQKATELGATEIQPLDTERSVARLSMERTAKRMSHWRQVVISACEQCGRNVLPEIHAPVEIMTWLQQMQKQPDSKFVLLPDGPASMRNQAKPSERIVLLIGAEGGLTESESNTAIQCGFNPIGMGNRILRTETAAIAGLAAIQTLWGDY